MDSGPEHKISHLTSEFIEKDDSLVRRLTVNGGTAETSVSVDSHSANPQRDWWEAYLRGARPERVDHVEPQTLRTVELFCGPGGLGLGFDQAAAELGMRTETLAAIDLDAEAVDVYARNREVGLPTKGSVSMLVDYHIRGLRDDARFHYTPTIEDEAWASLVGQVDVVLAGPPCQGHSNLNNRTRRKDARNELYLTVPAIAVALGAPMIVIENVPAVVHDELGVVEQTRALLTERGYAIEDGVLNASKIGWAQNRSRFFLVARKTHDYDEDEKDELERLTPIDGARPPVSLDTVESGLAMSPLTLSWALRKIPKRGRPSFMFDTPEMSDENVERIEFLHTPDETGAPVYDLPNSMRPDCHKDGTTYNSVYGRLKPGEPSPTITTGFFTPGRGRYIHPKKKRVINAAEAARLQGFPDGYLFQPVDGDIPARGQLAKWIGDAVPMPLGHAAGLSALLPEIVE